MGRKHERNDQLQREGEMAVTEVKKPILLDENMGDVNILHPAKGTLKLQMEGVYEATLTLEDKAEVIPMHGWVKIYNQNGFVGIYRRTSRGRNIGTDNSYTLKHGIDILQDSIWDSEGTYEGRCDQFLRALLNKQTHLIQGPGDSEPRKPWVLGSCADHRDVKKDVNYDNLMDLFEGITEEGGDYYFTYDQTVWPWEVSLVAKPVAVESEFRLDRNMDRCTIKDNDSELCTRLILSINEMIKDNNKSTDTTEVKQNQTAIKTYNNTTAQANYGIIVKTADIDVENDTFPNGPFPEADAWANDFLLQRAEPQLQVEIDGEVLKGITGDDWDESKIGTNVRVSLPEYSTAIEERCVTVTYPDLYGTPDRITVSLANALPTFTKSMKATQKTVSRQGRSGRGSARDAKDFKQHFQITDDNQNILQQAGLKLDANGLLVYADDNVNMIGSRFNIQADRIGMVVGWNDHGNYIKAGQIVLSINEDHGTTALIQADTIDIQGIVNELTAYDVTVETLTTYGTITANGEAQFNEGADFNSSDVTGIVNLTADNADFDSFTLDNFEGVWDSVSIYHITTTSSNQYFLYGASATATTVSGAKYGSIVTGATTTTIHYLKKVTS